PASAATVVDLKCKTTVTDDLSPGVSSTPAIQTTTYSGSLTKCTSPSGAITGITSGTTTGSFVAQTPADCSGLVGTQKVTGTLHSSYNNGQTSTFKMTSAVIAVSGTTIKATFKGKVTAGVGTGDKLKVPVTLTSANGDCTNTPVTELLFAGTQQLYHT